VPMASDKVGFGGSVGYWEGGSGGFRSAEKWNGREIDVADKEVIVKDTVTVLELVSGKTVKFEDFGTEEEVPDFRKRVGESQRWLKVLDETGIGSPDLTSLRGIGVNMRDLKDFLEEKKTEGILGGSIGGSLT